MSAATQALTELDSDALSRLEMRALELIGDGVSAAALPEIAARHRVFAAVVAATGENLGIMERAGSRGLYGETRTRTPWGR